MEGGSPFSETVVAAGRPSNMTRLYQKAIGPDAISQSLKHHWAAYWGYHPPPWTGRPNSRSAVHHLNFRKITALMYNRTLKNSNPRLVFINSQTRNGKVLHAPKFVTPPGDRVQNQSTKNSQLTRQHQAHTENRRWQPGDKARC